ncbi:MAG: hypothetical protein HFE30_02680 [Clostridiales bacterium]|nr:hypothetical protein [Clostridiales bacterium]
MIQNKLRTKSTLIRKVSISIDKNVFLVLLSLILLLCFVSCSSDDQTEENGGITVEQGNSSYVYAHNHLYYPDNAIKGVFSDYNVETDVNSTLFGGEDSTELTTTYHSVAVWDKSLYCCVNQSNANTGEYDFLVKINTETGEYKQLDYIVYDLLWQANDTAYFCAYKKGDTYKRTGIYKLNMIDESVTLIYEDNNANIIKGSKEDIPVYTFNGKYKIHYIQGNTIYFVKQDSANIATPHTICTIHTNGKKYKEHYSASRVYNMFPLNDRIYFYGWLGMRDPYNNNPINANYYIEDNNEIAEDSDIKINEELHLYKGNIYGYNGSDYCRVSSNDKEAEAQILFSKRGSFVGFCGDWIITSQENKVFHAIKCDGTERKHFDSIADTYKFAYNLLSYNSNSTVNDETTTPPQELSKYDSIKVLFSKSKEELYDGEEMPSPIDTDGGSEIYNAPDSENTYYYFPLKSGDEVSYLYAINAPISYIFEGKDTVILSELKEEFGDSLKTEFSDYMGTYTAYAEYNGLSLSFGVYENEETASFESVIIQETK